MDPVDAEAAGRAFRVVKLRLMENSVIGRSRRPLTRRWDGKK